MTDQVRNPEVRDVSLRDGLWFTGGLIAAAIVIHLALWLLFAAFVTDETEKRGSAPPLTGERPRPPAGPATQAGQEWVDRKAGIVRIPIEEAMTIQAEKLPVRQGASERAKKTKREVPTDSGSGRFVEQGGQP